MQTNWFRVRAIELGGQVWTDGGLNWTDGPDGQNLMFPCEIDEAALGRGVRRARERGHAQVGAWLGSDVDTRVLARAGFERGWSPRWMTAPISSVPDPVDPRVELQQQSDDYVGEHAGYEHQLAVTRCRPAFAWYAAAYHPAPTAPRGRRFAGRAWSFLDTGGQAGVFDMAVWPPFRRQGLGMSLLGTVCAAAARAGARQAVLNATDEGALLYRAAGFTTIAEGSTWWLTL